MLSFIPYSTLQDMWPPDEVYAERRFWSMKYVSFLQKLMANLEKFMERVFKLTTLKVMGCMAEHLGNQKAMKCKWPMFITLISVKKVYVTLANIWWTIKSAEDRVPNSSFFLGKPTKSQRQQVTLSAGVGLPSFLRLSLVFFSLCLLLQSGDELLRLYHLLQ